MARPASVVDDQAEDVAAAVEMTAIDSAVGEEVVGYSGWDLAVAAVVDPWTVSYGSEVLSLHLTTSEDLIAEVQEQTPFAAEVAEVGEAEPTFVKDESARCAVDRKEAEAWIRMATFR